MRILLLIGRHESQGTNHPRIRPVSELLCGGAHPRMSGVGQTQSMSSIGLVIGGTCISKWENVSRTYRFGIRAQLWRCTYLHLTKVGCQRRLVNSPKVAAQKTFHLCDEAARVVDAASPAAVADSAGSARSAGAGAGAAGIILVRSAGSPPRWRVYRYWDRAVRLRVLELALDRSTNDSGRTARSHGLPVDPLGWNPGGLVRPEHQRVGSSGVLDWRSAGWLGVDNRPMSPLTGS